MPPRRRSGRVVLALLLLLVVTYLIWDRVEARGLARDIAEIKKRGEPIDLDERRTPPRTDEQRQAAHLYAAAAGRVREISDEDGYRFAGLDVDRVGAPVPNLEELEATYRKDAPALQLLDQATPLDFGGFGPIAPEFYSNQSPLVSLSALNALRADLLARRGDADGATTALVASVRLQRAIPDPFYRYQSTGRLLGSLRILLRHTSPAETPLVSLQRAFEELPDDDDGLAREIMQRRAVFLESFAGRRRSLGEAILFTAFHPIVTRFARRQLPAFGEAIAVARQPWPGKLEAAAALKRRYPDPAPWRNRGTLRNLIEQGPPAIGLASLYPEPAGLALAARRIAITVVGVERYRRAHAGAVPPALDAVVPAFMTAVPQDPFSGKPLMYKKDADSYLLYSIDINGADDGGVLYGIGAMAMATGPSAMRSPRDLGIRVPLRRH
jgi:hypothetical protein